MADDSFTPETPATGEPVANGQDSTPQIGLISQYVKDMSFENPNAPLCYQWTSQPQIDVQFNIGTQQVGDEVHESILKLDVTAQHPEGKTFIVELSYAGLFAVRNVPADGVHAFMLAEAPRILFPFARRVLADAVRDGGFPPLLLDPIDFNQMYLQNAQAINAQGEGEAAASDMPSAADTPQGNA